ncbi:MAG: TraX family protein, partial [Lachnospiraceae bacterium]|nr:TraX family protein [Lachnospiraceae bacterium]
SALKTVAIVSMVIDHIAVAFLDGTATQEPFLRVLSFIMHAAGRLAFPLFLFLMIEGIRHTGNMIKYLSRMAVFAVISEVPFDLCFFGKIWYPEKQNTLFTLTVCLAVLILIKRLYETDRMTVGWKTVLSVPVITAGCVLAEVLHFDYGALAVAAAVLMYAFSNKNIAGYCAGTAVLMLGDLSEAFAFLTVPLVALYNGQRGRGHKYFFYVFYPAHIMILWLIKLMLRA